MLKKLIVIGILGYASYKIWLDIKPQPALAPLYSEPYTIVYGRDTCGNTQSMLKALRREGIVYDYRNVDDPLVADDLHSRMEHQGLDTRRYMLPVIEQTTINGAGKITEPQMSTNPEQMSIIAVALSNGS